ncbi:ruBisCO-associated protein-like [Neltuma alba]|uniref:ruBisCO-associated protein-like n=1 Tax=Neltuma alba TaxID=207710 RepID=UPI0010A58AAF|nr:ruBisCO-associated protein-like [Prosopis alba]
MRTLTKKSTSFWPSPEIMMLKEKTRPENFFPYFDTSSLNAEAIQNIKGRAESTPVKFFLSIGGRNPKFPFAVTSAQQSDWIKNATETLKQIVQNYSIDGIDVYYEHINFDARDQFGRAIATVIRNLKKDESITDASITVSSPFKNDYQNLYKANSAIFNYVVYQTHTEPARICTFEQLVDVYGKLHYYPKEKILAGYSDVRPGDWTNVPPPIFLGSVPQLLDMGLFGISKWVVTTADHNPEN